MYTNPVSMSYANDGENLGYHLPPNSDELLVALDWLALPRARFQLRYQLIRHGDHPSAAAGEAVIHGDIDKPFDWSPGVLLPRQDVPRGRALRLEQRRDDLGQLGPAGRPVRLSASATVARTSWDANDSGETAPDPRWRAIVGLGVEVFRRRRGGLAAEGWPASARARDGSSSGPSRAGARRARQNRRGRWPAATMTSMRGGRQRAGRPRSMRGRATTTTGITGMPDRIDNRKTPSRKPARRACGDAAGLRERSARAGCRIARAIGARSAPRAAAQEREKPPGGGSSGRAPGPRRCAPAPRNGPSWA